MFDILYPILKLFGYTFVLFDIDKLGELNEQLGYHKVNSMLKLNLRYAWNINRMGDLIFRYFSGDEFIIAIKGNYDDAKIACNRLQNKFNLNNISATYVISNNVKKASDIMTIVKPKHSQGLRGCVITINF
jgi:GGDEF domain-containing protein